jgi:hypothetical protein
MTGNNPSDLTAKEQLSNKPLVFMHDDCAVVTFCSRKIRHTLFSRDRRLRAQHAHSGLSRCEFTRYNGHARHHAGLLLASVKTDNYI